MTGPAAVATVSGPMVEEALLAAAEAAASGLPAEGPWFVRPGPAGPTPVPDDGTRAVAITLPGVGRLALLLSGPLAAAVLAGPPATQDLAGGLSPALAAAVAAICTRLGLAFPDVDDPVEIDPVSAVGIATLLFDGDGHAATLVLSPDAADAAGADMPVADHQFGALPASPGGHPAGLRAGPIELLHDVEMGVTVELGRTRMLVRDILDLSPGSVIELDRAAGAPIDVLVNGTLIARGEVVVIDEEFGIRITEVIGYDDGSRGSR
jgi:flagellar motor switch protein FliN